MSGNPVADQVWRSMSSLVLDNKDRWRRTVVDRTGLPFSRIRILRRLAAQPMTVKEVAEAATIDAPAATVAVNDLEARGLVVRQPHPENRRCKLVSLTDAGREVIAVLDETDDPAPQMLASLDEQDLQALQEILARVIS
ncbi:MarR family transcriptional regulator [Mycobacterium crocinum]|uniref:MarR family transcriptional regulator n=1 Tax=Mycolicibacterium crocinum TaxID=388459 RepID=A0ABY3TWU6_9MYCO|nr:MarR family transcriptional regulator [Mycolicibacterium crocinum]MCV7215835.1 MarR family transcriptional regulator [Mycolicibacterium crocinum]ULN44535.1 MarR family transcriptional regulator [Mycolicibacterium crocinum]